VKWIGIALFAAVLFIYELYDLWALPRATAWLVLGYFAVALAFAVRVDIESAAGRVSLDSEVQATYDLRPSRLMLIVYVLPFLLAGFLWTTLLLRRRRARTRPGEERSDMPEAQGQRSFARIAF
jgi:hypothetical protein